LTSLIKGFKTHNENKNKRHDDSNQGPCFLFISPYIMKKFISISAIVVAITSVAIISLGSARITSHYHSDSRIRPTTNRLFAYNYRNHLRRKKVGTTNELAKFKFWYNFQQQKKVTYNRHNYAAWRSAHDALFPRDNNLHSTEKNIVRNDDALVVRTTRVLPKRDTNGWVHDIEGISFELPKDVTQNIDEQYTDRMSDLVFEINKFDNGCTSLGFQQCAITRAKHLRARRSLRATSNVSREFSLRRTIVGNRSMLVPHFQEAFTVNDFGIERTYVIHTIQNPLTDEVVYIEGWSSVYDAPRAENLLRAVSRTIRFE